MNFKTIRYIMGKILRFLSFFIAIPIIVSLFNSEDPTIFLPYVYISIGTLIVSFLLTIKTNKSTSMRGKEGLLIAGLTYIFASLIAALPLFLNKQIPNYVDAVFEIASGFSTTGASIINDVEILEKSTLFYRALSQWIGGMGILVFILSIISAKDEKNSIHLLRAESTGPNVGKLSTKMRFTTRTLYLIYIGITLLEFILLSLGELSMFDSLCLSLATTATGGFGVLNTSVIAYGAYTQYVLIVFMFLSGINFGLYYFLLIKKFKKFITNEEFLYYISIIIGVTAIIMVNNIISYKDSGFSFEQNFRYSLFSVVSLITTTGFSNYDYSLFPTLSLLLLLIISIIGSSAGSTAGGMKISRLLIVNKSALSQLSNKATDNSVKLIKINGEVVDKNTISETKNFAIIYAILIMVVALLITIDGTHSDVLSNISASIACLSNVGPGIGQVGPLFNFSTYSIFSKIILSLTMIVGRLELFPILIMFNHKTWRRY